MRCSRFLASSALASAAFLSIASTQSANAESSFLGRFDDVTTVSSTVLANGDLNPYGVAVVHHSTGDLHRGDVLVSNFNNSNNAQGTGTTIVEISPAGQQEVFATVPQLTGGTGLTTALAILPRGFVIVGSLPTGGGSAPPAPGALVVLDRFGQVAATFSGGDIDGPWDLTAVSHGTRADVFFTNALSGTVVRMTLDLRRSTPRMLSNKIIGSGFPQRLDPSALVIGPTGLGLSRSGTLYVADTLDSAIRAIPDALERHTDDGTGRLVSSGGLLNGPLGLAMAPNGDILTVNGGDGNIVETTPFGATVAHRLLDSTGTPPNQGAGALFGLALAPHGRGVYFVDDNVNTLMLLDR